MGRFKTIPKAKQRIKNLLRELGLRPKEKVEEFIKNRKHLYSTRCLNKKGEGVFIKVILENKKRFFDSLKREGQILKHITENKTLNKKIKITRYLEGNLGGSLPWFMHEFVPGKRLGEFYTLEQKSTKYIKPLIANLLAIHNLSPAHKRKIKSTIKLINIIKPKRYEEILKGHCRGSPKLRKLVDFKALAQLFKENYKYLKKAPIVLTQGDFTLANHIVNKNQICLTDWEWVRFDNFCVDLTHLWIQSWQYPNWQKQLLKTYLRHLDKKSKRIFEQSFKIIAVVQALNELRWNVEICPKIYKKKASQFCLRTIKKVLRGESLI